MSRISAQQAEPEKKKKLKYCSFCKALDWVQNPAIVDDALNL